MDQVLNRLTPAEMDFLIHDWPTFAHDHQLPPPGLWSVWLMMGGRGAGKTRAGAEWVRHGHRGTAGAANQLPVASLWWVKPIRMCAR